MTSQQQSDPALQALSYYLNRSDEELDLSRAALVIASAHYPSLVIDTYLKQLAQMERTLRPPLRSAHTPLQQVALINAYLFDELGFEGDRQDYFDPRNSFLNEVLDRKRGIPITLSLIYLDIAQRLFLPIFPVGMPYHFFMRYETPQQQFYIDPFYGGAILTETECFDRISEIAGETVLYDPTYLQVTPKRIFLYRLLNNLKRHYLENNRYVQAEIVLKQLLIILPESIPNLRELGKISLQDKRYPEALDWFQRYLDAEPNAQDAPHVVEAMSEIHRLKVARN
ncbi:hypothetical protein LBMAG21_17060 [Armatimonadota bacterium]|nr:hypothetical protein LBMAG21_17060 [Armatimonadota bacterium]